jgi:hypothetical protein
MVKKFRLGGIAGWDNHKDLWKRIGARFKTLYPYQHAKKN